MGSFTLEVKEVAGNGGLIRSDNQNQDMASQTSKDDQIKIKIVP